MPLGAHSYGMENSSRLKTEGETKLLETGFTGALSRSVEVRCGSMMPFTQYVLLDKEWISLGVLDEAS